MTNEQFKTAIDAATTPQQIREICVRAGVENGSLVRDWTGEIAPVESVIAAGQQQMQRERAQAAITEATARVEIAERQAYMERERAKQVYAEAAKAGQSAPAVQPAPTKKLREIPVVLFDADLGELPGTLRYEHEEDIPRLLKKNNARLRNPNEMIW